MNLCLDQLRRREAPAAASIDHPHGDGAWAFELPDPDPRIQAELSQGGAIYPEKISGSLSHNPGASGS